MMLSYGSHGFEIYSEEVSIPAGMAPQWVRSPLMVPTYLLLSDEYYLFLYTGDTQGVARAYAECYRTIAPSLE